MVAFTHYLVAYYSVLILALLFVFVAPLGMLLSGWALGLAAFLPLVAVTLMGGFDSLLDLRVTLAFSTALNLTFLLLGVAVCV